jgi:hypothetical protein
MRKLFLFILLTSSLSVFAADRFEGLDLAKLEADLRATTAEMQIFSVFTKYEISASDEERKIFSDDNPVSLLFAKVLREKINDSSLSMFERADFLRFFYSCREYINSPAMLSVVADAANSTDVKGSWAVIRQALYISTYLDLLHGHKVFPDHIQKMISVLNDPRYAMARIQDAALFGLYVPIAWQRATKVKVSPEQKAEIANALDPVLRVPEIGALVTFAHLRQLNPRQELVLAVHLLRYILKGIGDMDDVRVEASKLKNTPVINKMLMEFIENPKTRKKFLATIRSEHIDDLGDGPVMFTARPEYSFPKTKEFLRPLLRQKFLKILQDNPPGSDDHNEAQNMLNQLGTRSATLQHNLIATLDNPATNIAEVFEKLAYFDLHPFQLQQLGEHFARQAAKIAELKADCAELLAEARKK